MKNETYECISEEITLTIGDKTKIKIGFMNAKTIVYCGMISKDIFSIALIYGTGRARAFLIIYSILRLQNLSKLIMNRFMF